VGSPKRAAGPEGGGRLRARGNGRELISALSHAACNAAPPPLSRHPSPMRARARAHAFVCT